MDDKHLDEILRGKLEAFQDTTPVNEAAMLSMMEGLKAVQMPLPWYAPIKPFLVPAVTSLVAGAAILIVVWMNFQRQTDVHDQEISEIENTVIVTDSNQQENPNNFTLSQPNSSIPKNNPTDEEIQFFGGPDSPELAKAGTRNTIRKSVESVDNHSISLDSLVNAVKWVDSGSRQVVGVSFPTGLTYLSEVKSDLPDKIIYPNPNVIPKTKFGVRIGARFNSVLNKPDIGRPTHTFAPGIFTEVVFNENLSLGVGANYFRQSHSLLEPKRHFQKVKHYPGIPNLAEVDLREIRSSSSIISLPCTFNFRPGNSGNNIRPLLSVGVIGGKVLSQSFRYQKPGGDYYPEVKPRKTPKFGVMAMHFEAGTEIKLDDKLSGRMTVFYNQPIKSQGVEGRKFTMIGISGAIAFGKM